MLLNNKAARILVVASSKVTLTKVTLTEAEGTQTEVTQTEVTQTKEAKLLIAAGFQVIEAMNDGDALAKAQSEHLDLILLNGKYTDSNGADLCYLLKNDPKTKTTLILQTCSALGECVSKTDNHNACADNYLRQPFSPEELIANVKLLLRLGVVERELCDVDLRHENFLSMLVHDLRNPLAPILNSVELLLRLNTEVSPVQEKALSTIQDQTRLLAQILESVLARSSISQNKISVDRKFEDITAAQISTNKMTPPTDTQPSPVAITSNIAKRVLVVDDNTEGADTLAQWLKLAGHRVQTAYTGAEAIQLAPEFNPDIVLLDISLPDLNGFDVAKRLRELPNMKKFVVVAVTGYGHESAKKNYRERGFDDHFVKPMDVAKLRSIGIEMLAK